MGVEGGAETWWWWRFGRGVGGLRRFDGDMVVVVVGGHSVSPGAACWSEVTQLVAR